MLIVAGGVSESQARRQSAEVEALIDLLLDGADMDELVAMAVQQAREQAPEINLTDEQLAKSMRGNLSKLNNAWMRFFLTYDPAEALRQVKCPVLAINGTKDLQVWHEQNLDAIIRIMSESGGDLTATRYEGLNHLFQPAETGSVAEYSQIEITFDEAVLRDMVRWIQSKVN